MKQSSVLVQQKDVRNSKNFRVARQSPFVFVPVTVVDVYGDEILFANSDKIGVFLEKSVQRVAPRTPVAAHVQDDAFAGLLRLGDCVFDVSRGVSGGIVSRTFEFCANAGTDPRAIRNEIAPLSLMRAYLPGH
jgi:hypothetical protein